MGRSTIYICRHNQTTLLTKTMKKVLTLLSVCAAFTFAACNNADTTDANHDGGDTTINRVENTTINNTDNTTVTDPNAGATVTDPNAGTTVTEGTGATVTTPAGGATVNTPH
jgi:hypothetical protein